MDKNITKRKALLKKRMRVRKTIEGTPSRPRLSVYRSERHIYGQVIDDLSGRTLVAASTVDKELREQVKSLTPKDSATKVGEALADRAKAQGIEMVAFDRGGRRYTGRIAALADGARSRGLQF
ncbi:MAG: 50S ribosomal protein L18 [Planctomycetota bacterium]|nr:MAG: 50S ribosomal protein L18 [Planctomycetota bacterium]